MDIRPDAELADLGLPTHIPPPGASPTKHRLGMLAVYATLAVACLAAGVWSVVSGNLPTWGPVLWSVGGFGAAALYTLPATSALLHRHHRADRIVALNIACGWLPIVWVVCLVWSLRKVPQTAVERPAIAAANTPPAHPASDGTQHKRDDSPSTEVACVEASDERSREPQTSLIPVQRVSNPFELPDPTTTRALVAHRVSCGSATADSAEHLAAAQARVQRRQLTGGPRYALQPGPTPAEQWIDSIVSRAAGRGTQATTNAALNPTRPDQATDKPAPDPTSIVDLAPPT